jgi:hypothetical protein
MKLGARSLSTRPKDVESLIEHLDGSKLVRKYEGLSESRKIEELAGYCGRWMV